MGTEKGFGRFFFKAVKWLRWLLGQRKLVEMVENPLSQGMRFVWKFVIFTRFLLAELTGTCHGYLYKNSFIGKINGLCVMVSTTAKE